MRLKTTLFACGILMSNFALGQILEIEKSPYSLPQTNFNFGSVSYKFHVTNKNLDYKWSHQGKGLNTYGFDIEIPHTDFMNFGVFYRFDYYNEKSAEARSLADFDFRFANFLGVFTRLQYHPFKSRLFNLFARVDGGLGPVIMKFAGFSLQGGLQAGIESYFNNWIGLSVSYAHYEEWGKETLIGSAKSDNDDTKSLSRITIRSSGNAIIFGIKTTYF